MRTTEISYERNHGRLRISGTCGSQDTAAVRDAIESVAEPGRGIIVDLTAVVSVDADAAGAILAAAGELERAGRRVTIVRRHQSQVDRTLQAILAEADDRRA